MGLGHSGTGNAFPPLCPELPPWRGRLLSASGVCRTNAAAHMAGIFSLPCRGRGGRGRDWILKPHTHTGGEAVLSVGEGPVSRDRGHVLAGDAQLSPVISAANRPRMAAFPR